MVNRITEHYTTIFSLNPSRLPDAQRHPFHAGFLKENPQFRAPVGFSGLSHICHWHMTGHDGSKISNNILKLADLFGHSSTCDQLLHQFMHHASGHVTRAVDLAFGVIDPVMRDRYRAVFEKSPTLLRRSLRIGSWFRSALICTVFRQNLMSILRTGREGMRG